MSGANSALDNWAGHKPNCIGGRRGPCNCGADGEASDPFVMMSLIAQYGADARSLRQKGADDGKLLFEADNRFTVDRRNVTPTKRALAEDVHQIMPPRPLNNFADFTQLMHDTKTLPYGQSAFTLAVPYVFDAIAEFTPASLQAMKDGLRAQLELGLQVLDAAIKGEVLEEKRIIVPGN